MKIEKYKKVLEKVLDRSRDVEEYFSLGSVVIDCAIEDPEIGVEDVRELCDIKREKLLTWED